MIRMIQSAVTKDLYPNSKKKYLDNKKKTRFLKNEQKTRPINKGRFTMADKYIKKCSTFVTKEMQVNTKERCYFAPSKMAIIKKTNRSISP